MARTIVALALLSGSSALALWLEHPVGSPACTPTRRARRLVARWPQTDRCGRQGHAGGQLRRRANNDVQMDDGRRHRQRVRIRTSARWAPSERRARTSSPRKFKQGRLTKMDTRRLGYGEVYRSQGRPERRPHGNIRALAAGGTGVKFPFGLADAARRGHLEHDSRRTCGGRRRSAPATTGRRRHLDPRTVVCPNSLAKSCWLVPASSGCPLLLGEGDVAMRWPWGLFFRRFGGLGGGPAARPRAPPPSAALGLRALLGPQVAGSAAPGARAADAQSRAARSSAVPPAGAAPRQLRLAAPRPPAASASTPSSRQSRPIGAGAGGAGAAPLRPDLEAAPRSPAAAAPLRRALAYGMAMVLGRRLGLARRRRAVGSCLFFQESFCCVVGHVAQRTMAGRCDACRPNG